MAGTTLVPLAEFLKHIDDRPAYEYVDGLLIEKPKGSYLHGLLQTWFGHLFQRYPKYALVSELHSRLRETEYRLPDLAVQYRRVALSEQYAITPLLMAIEILSPNDDVAAVFEKCTRYHKWGVPSCWVFDPEKRVAWSYDGGDEPRVAEEKLQVGEISFTLDEVFRGLDSEP